MNLSSKVDQLRTATGIVLEATKENLVLAAESIGSGCLEIFLEDGTIIIIGQDYSKVLDVRIKDSHPMH